MLKMLLCSTRDSRLDERNSFVRSLDCRMIHRRQRKIFLRILFLAAMNN
jgi:hypothetical protein